METVRHIHNPEFGAVTFRRESPQITNEGGLWDESEKLYPLLGAKGIRQPLQWTFPSGARETFTHLQHESDVFNHQGAQIPLIKYDELTQCVPKTPSRFIE
jgi:hypothetical protein